MRVERMHVGQYQRNSLADSRAPHMTASSLLPQVETQKLEWAVGSRIGSLQNAAHKPGGGDKKILTQKVPSDI